MSRSRARLPTLTSRANVSHTDLSKASDPLGWSLPLDNIKKTSGWTCDWSDEDDAHLLVGVWKYGHGNWEPIREDPALGLADKLFLEDAKTKPAEGSKPRLPNAIHLVRRADYLLHSLRELDEQKKGGQSGPAPSKTHQPRAGASRPKHSADRASESASSAAPSASKPKSSSSKPSLSKAPKRKATPQYSSSGKSDSEYDSMDEEACKEALRPVKRELKRLKSGNDDVDRQEKVRRLKETLSAIGARIEVIAGAEKSPAMQEQRRKHLCE